MPFTNKRNRCVSKAFSRIGVSVAAAGLALTPVCAAQASQPELPVSDSRIAALVDSHIRLAADLSANNESDISKYSEAEIEAARAESRSFVDFSEYADLYTVRGTDAASAVYDVKFDSGLIFADASADFTVRYAQTYAKDPVEQSFSGNNLYNFVFKPADGCHDINFCALEYVSSGIDNRIEHEESSQAAASAVSQSEGEGFEHDSLESLLQAEAANSGNALNLNAAAGSAFAGLNSGSAVDFAANFAANSAAYSSAYSVEDFAANSNSADDEEPVLGMKRIPINLLKARQYAEKWTSGANQNKMNPDYPDYPEANCTNFVSQIVHEAGMNYVDGVKAFLRNYRWKPGVASWSAAHNNYKWMRFYSGVYTRMTDWDCHDELCETRESDLYKAGAGYLIYTDWMDGKSDGTIDHALFVNRVEYVPNSAGGYVAVPHICQKTTNRFDEPMGVYIKRAREFAPNLKWYALQFKLN
ncbi:MAG: amidase domain-containing protein [Bifidobacteriaceae bacterium]|nr:amidase domain-containing protein [Bifidobacteriaceae bacterium]